MTEPRPRTAAATDALRERGASSAAERFLVRLEHLTDKDLLTVTERLLVECEERGLPVPEL